MDITFCLLILHIDDVEDTDKDVANSESEDGDAQAVDEV